MNILFILLTHAKYISCLYSTSLFSITCGVTFYVIAVFAFFMFTCALHFLDMPFVLNFVLVLVTLNLLLFSFLLFVHNPQESKHMKQRLHQ